MYKNVCSIFAKDEVRLEVKRVLQFHKYPPDDQPRAVVTVIEQAEMFVRRSWFKIALQMKIDRMPIVVLILLIASKASCQIIIRDETERLKIKGNVKSLTELDYDAEDYFGELRQIGDNIQIVNCDFDIHNRPIFVQKLRNGKVYEEITVEYSTKEGVDEIRALEDGNKKHTEIIKYDSRGNVVEHVLLRNDTITKKEYAKYDSRDSTLEYCSYGKNGKMQWFKSWKYDQDGFLVEKTQFNDQQHYIHVRNRFEGNRLLESKEFDRNEDLLSTTAYIYDAWNRVIVEIKTPNPSGTFYKWTYSYNATGKIIEKLEFKSENGYNYSQARSENYKYDEKDRVLSHIITRTNSGFTKEFFEYDIYGNIIREENYYNWGNETSKSTNSYVYDDRGSRIKSISTYTEDTSKAVTSVKKSVEERTIVYR
jgi:hypothetical protein